MFYPICTSLDRIQSFTLDLNWNGSKRVHFGERSQTGTDSGSVPVRIQQVQCKRKAYLYPYWYGSVWIRSSVNGVCVAALNHIRCTFLKYATPEGYRVYAMALPLSKYSEMCLDTLVGGVIHCKNLTNYNKEKGH